MPECIFVGIERLLNTESAFSDVVESLIYENSWFNKLERNAIASAYKEKA
jgi:hypothetical protein